MSLKASCPQCQAEFKFNAGLAGRKAKCPKCTATITLPREVIEKAKAASTTKTATADPPSVPRRRKVKSNGGVKRSANSTAAVARKLDQAFKGDIKPVRKSIMYRVGILLVTLVMVILPLVYVGLIGLTGYAVYYHAVNHTEMLQYGRGRGKIAVFLAYLAPLVIGGILWLFMIKPLFARPARHVRRRSLTKQAEPLLFGVVERICETVKAPRPKRIDIDYQFNASASFRRGWLSFFGSDLVLTIGIPLVAGLSAREFVGVLSHEFGHFSQGLGMRLTYVVRNINAWFARVVYERDEWDEWLVGAAEDLDLRIGWILWLSRFCVFLTRCVLWVLMMIGHGISGFMLRQMEFDADRYETRVAGTESFISCSQRLRELSVCYGFMQESVSGLLSQGTFPDDLALIMVNVDEKMPDKVRRQIKKSVEEEKTGWFDTHPCDKDRIASAQRENAPGIFLAKGPASALLQNFDGLAKNVTWDLYTDLGVPIKPDKLDRTEDLFKEQEQASEPAAREPLPPIPFD